MLDAPEGTCGGIPHQFRLTALKGPRLADDAYQAHVEVARRCGAGLANVFEDDAGRQLTLPCPAAVGELPVHTIF